MTEFYVEFVNTGDELYVEDTETILRAALDEGIAQEYSCRVGMCLACSAEIIEGEVAQPAAHALTDQEKQNYALTCMARPQSDLKLRRGVYPPSIEKKATDGSGGVLEPGDEEHLAALEPFHDDPWYTRL